MRRFTVNLYYEGSLELTVDAETFEEAEEVARREVKEMGNDQFLEELGLMLEDTEVIEVFP